MYYFDVFWLESCMFCYFSPSKGEFARFTSAIIRMTLIFFCGFTLSVFTLKLHKLNLNESKSKVNNWIYTSDIFGELKYFFFSCYYAIIPQRRILRAGKQTC